MYPNWQSYRVEPFKPMKMLDMKLQSLICRLLGFGLALVQFLSVSLFVPVGIGMLTLGHFILDMEFAFCFHRGSQLRVSLESQGDGRFKFLSN